MPILCTYRSKCYNDFYHYDQRSKRKPSLPIVYSLLHMISSFYRKVYISVKLILYLPDSKWAALQTIINRSLVQVLVSCVQISHIRGWTRPRPMWKHFISTSTYIHDNLHNHCEYKIRHTQVQVQGPLFIYHSDLM